MLVPTRVGMILIVLFSHSGVDSCPHTRGDDPACITKGFRVFCLSPHAWG